MAADDATNYLDCPTTEVREGENVDVFLVRVTNHKHTTKYWAYWYTDAGTADETDYVHQSSDKVWTTDAEAAADRAGASSGRGATTTWRRMRPLPHASVLTMTSSI